MTISHIGLDQHVATIKFTFFEPTLKYNHSWAGSPTRTIVVTYLFIDVIVMEDIVLVDFHAMV